MDLSDTSYLLQAGGDVAQFNAGSEGSLRLGVMGAYGSSSNRANNGVLSASGMVDGYSAGVYGTWYGHGNAQSGPYVDSWVMAGSFNNRVSGQGLPTERYHASNVAASLEAGYALPVYEGADTQSFVEPQGQVIVSNYRAGDHTEQNGTVVSVQSGTSVTTRLGVRLHAYTAMKQIHPFVELNWWHGPSSSTIAFDGVAVSDALPANRLEAKFGLQGYVTKSVSVWGLVGFEAGERSYLAGKAQMGLKYAW